MQAVLEIQDAKDTYVYVYIVDIETRDISYYCYHSKANDKQKIVVHEMFHSRCPKDIRSMLQEYMKECIKKRLGDKKYNIGVEMVDYCKFFFLIRDLVQEQLIYKLVDIK